MTPTGFAYIATPYTKTQNLDRAFTQAARIAADLSLMGLTVFSPIAHGHALAAARNLDPKNPAVFDRLNKQMLDLCEVLIVVQMEGWSESDGVAEEVAFFERMHKPIFDCDPVTLNMVKREPQWMLEEIGRQREAQAVIYNDTEIV